MPFTNAWFIIGNAYAGKSTLVKLLAQKHGGILCGENWHDSYPEPLNAEEFPGLCYTRDLKDWREFIRRTPEEYAAWIDETAKECEILELRMLPELCAQGRPVFVDTNISIETLKAIAEPNHVLVMLADPDVSVRRFFERPDAEKQYLYRLLLEEPDPAAAMENYRKGLTLINSQENYDRLLSAGFPVLLRDETRTAEETLALAERLFGLAERIRLRPHHGMCFQFYEGKGYSAEFTDHMGRVIRAFSERPDTPVRLTLSADVVCERCPNNVEGICQSAEKVTRYDAAVLNACDLRDGDELTYADFAARVKDRILDAGLRGNICGDCEWDAICTKHRREP